MDKKDGQKVTLLIPTFNEIKGMREIMPRVRREWVDQILVIDGGSSDGTVEYAREYNYEVITQSKKGLRYSYIDGLKHATGDIIITFSPDGNSIPELIPALVDKARDGFDMVIVSRYALGAKSYDDSFITALGNFSFTFLINLFFKARYTDALVMFRAWKKEIFYNLGLDKDESYSLEEKIFRTKVGVEPLLSVRAAKKRLKFCDIPGDEPPRIGGERKLMVFQWGAAYLFEVFRELFFWRKVGVRWETK